MPKHDKQPLKADALAQANLDGGGNAGCRTRQIAVAGFAQKAKMVRAPRRHVAELKSWSGNNKIAGAGGQENAFPYTTSDQM